MGLCVLYYVEYSLYNVKKVGFFLSGLELHFKCPNLLLKQRQDLMSEFAKGTYEGPDKTLRTGKCPKKKQRTQGFIYRTNSNASVTYRHVVYLGILVEGH